MKAILASATLAVTSRACMSDKACEGNDITMCCYMNECVPSSNIGCSSKRLAFHEYLHSLKTMRDRREFADLLREASPRVRECDK